MLVCAWCGLVSGLIEVGVIIVRKSVFDHNHLYWISRHFVWLIPLVTMAVFLIAGVIAAVAAVWVRRRPAGWGLRLLAALMFLGPVWTALPRIHGLAGLLMALGAANQLVPALERRAAGFNRLVRTSFPFVAGLVIILAASVFLMDRQKTWREEARALPVAGSPNVLLIVLDTVRGDHLRVQGYDRPTSPTIDELAARGIRFASAQATASWTLMSHSSMFTGRWPHELSSGWFTPLDRTHPTLAEFLGSHGYATAGFIANYWYCASDSGLARGFAAYHDYIFPRLTAFKSTALVDRALDAVQATERFLEEWLEFDFFSPAVQQLGWLFKTNRKDASTVNGQFLDWVSNRRPDRPFFAFLNFYDAHYPYELSPSGIRRFSSKARTRREATLMRDWPILVQKKPSPADVDFGRNAYDDCLADLDEEIGRLVDELERRSILDKTWLIITADHGESFGENEGIFWHGTSLYQAQLQVPLVIVPPATGGVAPPRVIAETVSLRDLAATIVDLTGIKTGSPFPGNSLARFWRGSGAASPPDLAASPGPVLSEVVPLQSFGADPSQWVTAERWPLAAVTEGDWTYIRREGELKEELFRHDPGESRNLAGEPDFRPVLERMRQTLNRMTAGPLTPERLNP